MARTDEIIAFTTIVDLGTFSAAASHLHLTPAAISRRIKQLEERLGVTLLERTTRVATLTTAGELYNQRVRVVLDSMVELEDEVQNLTGKPAGKMKIHAPPVFTEKVLSGVLYQLLTDYPDLKLEIMTSSDRIDLETEMCDLAFWLSKSTNPSYINTPVVSIAFHVVASPNYLSANPPIKTVTDIQSHNCLLFTDQARKSYWMVPESGGVHRLNVAGNLVTNSSNVLLEAALNAQGLAYVPAFLYQEHVENGDLQLVLPETLYETKKLYAIHTDSMMSSKKVQLCINFIKANLSADQ